LDFWRVAEVKPLESLLLLSEMRLPGQAALEFKIESLPNGRTKIQQIARFMPRGLMGLLYWFAVSPLHEFVFNGMLKGIARASGKAVPTRPKRISLASLTNSAH
jgi:hypothetical protein